MSHLSGARQRSKREPAAASRPNFAPHGLGILAASRLFSKVLAHPLASLGCSAQNIFRQLPVGRPNFQKGRGRPNVMQSPMSQLVYTKSVQPNTEK